jgi:hypothetical protein
MDFSRMLGKLLERKGLKAFGSRRVCTLSASPASSQMVEGLKFNAGMGPLVVAKTGTIGCLFFLSACMTLACWQKWNSFHSFPPLPLFTRNYSQKALFPLCRGQGEAKRLISV